MRIGKLIVIVLALFLSSVNAKGQSNKEVLLKTLHFNETFSREHPDSISTNVYSKYFINLKKRNFTLSVVPSMFYLMRDKRRNFFIETYSHTTFVKGQTKSVQNLLISTIYHRETSMPAMEKYLTPHIYEDKVFEMGMLSPFNYNNRHFYRYRMKRNGNGTSTITIRSKVRNTQLFRRGYAIVDDKSGKIDDFSLEGEYDMMHFLLNGTMNKEMRKAMVPEKCDIQAKLSFLGNKITAHGIHFFDRTTTFPDSIVNCGDRELMASVRPVPLSPEEEQNISEFDSIIYRNQLAEKADTVKHKTSKMLKHFWDVLGDNTLNRIKADIGDEDQGQLRIGPIFNPFYFGYTKHKGVIYKFDVRGYYNFTDNNSINLRLKLGYSFKQKHLYYRIPLTWNFNKRRNGYVRLEFKNGNRISNSRVLESVKQYGTNDSIDWDAMHLDYFKDRSLHVGVNYDVVKNVLGAQGGFTTHKRTAVDKKGFEMAGRPTSYYSFAPYLQLQYRPLTDRVPLVITAQWEHGMHAFGGTIKYDRFEFDGQYTQNLSRMRSWELRAGYGFYTKREHDDYFLDYYNFHEDYIPDAWDDEWSGNFELLNSNWYNASSYYVRTNATYDSPLLLLAYCPLIGEIVERERIYMSVLAVSKMIPYVELGYGFTNRVFSMGVFTGFSPGHFEGVGMKFGFELFSNY